MLATPSGQHQRSTRTRTNLPIADSRQAFRVVTEPVTLTSGPGWVYVATSLGQVTRTTARLAGLLAAGLPVLLAVVALATWRAVGRGLRPVEQIRQSAAAISGTQPGLRVPVPPTHDEIARLAATMNAMLARIDHASTRQRQFVADASHELRSPLSALQAELDVALAHPGKEPRVEVLRRLSGQTCRMGQLLDDLLFLARTDEGAATARQELVDLDELVLAEVRRLRAAGRRSPWRAPTGPGYVAARVISPGSCATWATTPSATPRPASDSASGSAQGGPYWPSPTTGPALPRETGRPSSSGSPALTSRGPDRPSALGWASACRSAG